MLSSRIASLTVAAALGAAGLAASAPAEARTFVSVGVGTPGFYGYGAPYGYGYPGFYPAYGYAPYGYYPGYYAPRVIVGGGYWGGPRYYRGGYGHGYGRGGYGGHHGYGGRGWRR